MLPLLNIPLTAKHAQADPYDVKGILRLQMHTHIICLYNNHHFDVWSELEIVHMANTNMNIVTLFLLNWDMRASYKRVTMYIQYSLPLTWYATS